MRSKLEELEKRIRACDTKYNTLVNEVNDLTDTLGKIYDLEASNKELLKTIKDLTNEIRKLIEILVEEKKRKRRFRIW